MQPKALLVVLIASCLIVPTIASAQGLGRVSSVVPLDGGCVYQDSLPVTAVESWDVQQTRTYQVTLTHVTDCANGGTDPVIQVVVKNGNTGNRCFLASKVGTGVYTFQVTMPPNACETYPILYCTSACNENSGLFARRADGANKASHLRATNFGAGCSNPAPDVDCSLGCAGWVNDLGGGCGAPAPTLHATTPVAGRDGLISVKGAPAGAPLYLAANAVPFPPSVILGGGCVLHVDPATALIAGPFSTTSIGDFYLPIAPPAGLASLSFRIQGAVAVSGGPLPNLQLTNGIELAFGLCAPFCTYTAGSFTGLGSGAAIFDNNYESVFAAGLEIGVFNSANGASAPNGLRWTGDATGRAALEAFLAGAGGPSGALVADDTNQTSSPSGGSLAIQTAALALNIQFSAAGVSGGSQVVLGSLVYLKMDIPDSLSGLTFAQILAVANQALAGNGLPSGYTYDSLAAVIELLNGSFADCTMSEWSSHRVYIPGLP